MITNLPQHFPLSKLDEFYLGDVQPEADEILSNPLGFCRIKPVSDFLKGRKSIIVGTRGAGKTTLFKLLSENKVQFKRRKNQDQVLISINDGLDYQAIGSHINDLINTGDAQGAIKFRCLWEFYILYRILIKIKEQNSELVVAEEPISKIIRDFERIAGDITDKPSLWQLAKRLKLTSGVKFDAAHGGTLTIPNFYVAVEPLEKRTEAEEDKFIFRFSLCKREIEKFFEKCNIVAYVLIDNLDEFVVKENYEAQRLILQGLLECESSYVEYSRIKIRLFLRSDLYEKLDFEALGADKVEHRKIELIWTDVDIRKFLAQRILFNYREHLGMDRLEMTFREEKLYLDENSVDAELEQQEGEEEVETVSLHGWPYRKVKQFIASFFAEKQHVDKEYGRRVHFDDEVNRQIITTIFPRSVAHRNGSGGKEDVSIFEFLNSHLCLSNGSATPRILIQFGEGCLAHARDYYQRNPDEKVELNEYKEYPLIKKVTIAKAYSDFQKNLGDIFYKNSPPIWREWFNLLHTKKGTKFNFGYGEIKKLIKPTDELEFQQFLAFLHHIGYIQCDNTTTLHYNARKYMLPIVFRGCA